MAKKEKQKTDPKREELQAQNAEQETATAVLQETQPTLQAESHDTAKDELSDEEREQLRVEAYLKEKDEVLGLIDIFDSGYSCEEIIKEEGLEGVTPEQLRHFIRKQELFVHIHFMESAEEALTYVEMAEHFELDEDEVVHIVLSSNNKLSALLEEGKSHAEIAEALGIQEHVAKDYIKAYAFRENALFVIYNYFDRGYSAEDIAKSRKLDEDDVEDIIEGFKSKVFKYYAEKGKTIEQIAELTRTSVEGIIAIIGEDRRELRNLQAAKAQTLLQTRKAGKNARLERLTDLRDILIGEIKQRGLQEVSVDKIVTLYLKTEEAIGREEKELPQVVTSSKSTMFDTKEFSVI